MLNHVEDNELCLRNMWTIDFVLRDMGLYYMKDTLIDTCYIAIANACKYYDDTKSKESTYFCSAVRQEIIRELKRLRLAHHSIDTVVISLDADIQDTDNTLSDLLLVTRDDDKINFNYLLEIIDLCIDNERFRNKERLKNIVRLYYIEGYTLEEIANMYDVTRQNINGMLKLFCEKMKIYYEKYLTNNY